jgi:hypothetical protein
MARQIEGHRASIEAGIDRGAARQLKAAVPEYVPLSAF